MPPDELAKGFRHEPYNLPLCFTLQCSRIVRYLVRMRSVDIKVLNSKLSEYVRLAASGETILVTDHDQAVAELGPLRETRSSIPADAFLAEAVRSGVLTPPRLSASGPPPKPAPVATLDDVLADLDESRRDR